MIINPKPEGLRIVRRFVFFPTLCFGMKKVFLGWVWEILNFEWHHIQQYSYVVKDIYHYRGTPVTRFPYATKAEADQKLLELTTCKKS